MSLNITYKASDKKAVLIAKGNTFARKYLFTYAQLLKLMMKTMTTATATTGVTSCKKFKK